MKGTVLRAGAPHMQPLVFATLEDLHELTGQAVRLNHLLPHLARRFALTFVGRRGALSGALRPMLRDFIELPMPVGVRPAAWFLHPAGPARMARLAAALRGLNEPKAILYADSVLLALMMARGPHRRLAAEVNGVIASEFATHCSPAARLARPLVARWETAAFRKIERIIAVSPAISRHIQERLADGSKTRIAVIGNGIDPGRFHPGVDGTAIRRERGWGGMKIGIFVSTFRPWHGVDNLIRATKFIVPSVPDFKLVLVGDGPERAKAEALARDLGLQAHVEFPGAMAPEAVPAWIAAADVGLYYPALRPGEPFLFDPMKLYEYLAIGKPVVSIRLPDTPSSIADSGGVVWSDASGEAFAKAVGGLIENPAACERKGAAAARGGALQSWAAIAERIADFIED